MKIKNDLISVKIGGKQYDFNNLILDEYLKRFTLAQLDENNIGGVLTRKYLNYCLLKFDEPLKNLNSASKLKNQDFDICFVGGAKHSQLLNNNKITTEYTYETDWNVWDYSKNSATENYISNYYGRKITAIGFNVFWTGYNDSTPATHNYVCAVLDTSNYNIVLQEKQDLVITRKDIITTDGIFYSNDSSKVPCPAHLSPFGVPQVIYQNTIYNSDKTSWSTFNDNAYGVLYSVGLSSYEDYIDKEYVIGTDLEIENKGVELVIKGLKNYISNDDILHPGSNIFPGNGIYPTKESYKYIILKYKIWQQVHSGAYDNIITEIKETKYYYYEAIPISKFGKNNISIKYERG